MGNNKPLLAHLCLFGSGAFWGLMAPVGKDAMTHGIEGIDMVSFRVLGGAILFWLTSLFTRREHIPGNIPSICLYPPVSPRQARCGLCFV